ncbi:MAG: shikimate kinase [Lachnospiraceae bacterium]|nr:shikimate kinase [Lachnospiraceae bacterium]
MKNNIVLIGMPGAGKSTVGVLLAKAMNYSFMDTDLTIQQENGKKLYEIIADKGIDEFLNIENDVLSHVEANQSVIATGGSAVYGEEAMKHLSDIGHIVYIKLSCQEIVRRVSNIKTRGIAMKKGKTIFDIYAERVPLYEKYADIIVDGENTTIEECVERVVDAVAFLENKRL